MKNTNTQKTQWSPVRVSKAKVSTAVFNYLENQGYKVNRKRGLQVASDGAVALASR